MRALIDEYGAAVAARVAAAVVIGGSPLLDWAKAREACALAALDDAVAAARQDKALLVYAAKLQLYATLLAAVFFLGLHYLFNYLES